jgi:predicted metal-dependent hydrolase
MIPQSASTITIPMDVSHQMALEATDSWANYLEQHQQQNENNNRGQQRSQQQRPILLRQLKKQKVEDDTSKKNDSDEDFDIDKPTESYFHTDTTNSYLYQSLKEQKKREKAVNEMYRNPGIQDSTMHGMMVR